MVMEKTPEKRGKIQTIRYENPYNVSEYLYKQKMRYKLMIENRLNYLSLDKSGLVVRMFKTFIVRVLLVEGNEHLVFDCSPVEIIMIIW